MGHTVYINLLATMDQFRPPNHDLPKIVKSIFYCFLFLSISLTPWHTFAQYTYELDKITRFEHMGAEEGLSTGYVYNIHQDKYGFIWIGTQYGLNLYDGYENKIFYAGTEISKSLYNNYIFCIHEEPDGTMWFGTNLGISKYNRANQTFTSFLPDTNDINSNRNSFDKIIQDGDFLWVDVRKDDLLRFNKNTGQFLSFAKDTLNPSKGIYNSNTDYIFIDGSGVLWVCSGETGAEHVLSRFNKETETFTHFINDPSHPESFVGEEVRSMMEDSEGIIWVATWGGGLLRIIDKEKGKFRQFVHDENIGSSIISNYLNDVYEDSNRNIWVTGLKGFSLVKKEIGHFTNHLVPNRSDFPNRVNNIRIINEDKNGDLYFTARDGYFKFNPTTKVLLHYLHDPQNQSSISHSLVKQVLHEPSGQTWIVLPNSSINIINPFSNVFRRTQKRTDKQNSLWGNSVSRFFTDSRGNFWVGGGHSGGGLNRTNVNNRLVYDNFEHYVYDVDDPNSISDNRIAAICEDRDQMLWIGTWAGLNSYDYNTNSFTSFQYDKDDSTTISGNTVMSVYEDSYGILWVGTRSGLNIFDRASGEFIRFLPDSSDSTSISSIDVRVIFEDSYGDLWFGGSYLEKLKRQDTSFISYFTDSVGVHDYVLFDAWNIEEDDSANLWISTNNLGLKKYNRRESTFTSLTIQDGLPSNTINALKIDDRGFIWVSSNQGLSRINPVDYSIRNFDMADGLVSLEFLNRSSYKDDEGWLYFGSRDGFNVFHPDSIKENKCIPPVYITSLNVAGKPMYFEKPLFEMSGIELPHNENDFSFDFVALNYVNPQKNQYAYMLEGYDKDWNYVGNRRTAFYTNLSPGKYTFRVKGSNNDGYWNEKGASLSLIIYPPFWKTWWAYVIYVLVFFVLVYLLRRNELRKIYLRQELELEQVNAIRLAELDVEKNKFFSNISHEFRTPLTLILGPLNRFIAKLNNEEQKQELGLVKRNALRLQTLINQLLSLSKIESGKMKLKARPENIVKLINLFLQSFHSMAEDKGIRLEFESDAEEYTVYVDPIKFEKVVNNLLSNAFKFTERGGKVQVAVSSKLYAKSNQLTSPEIANVSAGQAGRQPARPVGGLPTADSDGKYVEIRFSDTGVGIQKEDLPHVFDRFYQVDETQMKTNLGTGIGLALTKELVELHHGTITADSEPGLGTTFTIQLLPGKEHLSEGEVYESGHVSSGEENELLNDDYLFTVDPATINVLKTEGSGDGKLPLLLIVEDNEDMRTYIKSYLIDSFQIIEATNGKEGAEKAIEHIPDLIVSDLMMPKLDGNEMTLQLKTDERTSHIPIILLTAKASKESRLEGLETGADDFLTKPFDADELLIRINNLINQRKRLRDIFGKKLSYSMLPAMTELKDFGMTSMDEQFLKKAVETVERDMSDPEFGVRAFSEQMGLSRMQLHRKLKALLDQSTTEFIKTIRLNKAAILLKTKSATAAEIGYDVGFNSPTYFSSCFKEHFGKSPSEYAKE